MFVSITLFRREETAFYFDVQATPRPCTSKQEKVPFFGRERCVFVFLCSKKITSGQTLRAVFLFIQKAPIMYKEKQ
jgi:hypothetical protein